MAHAVAVAEVHDQVRRVRAEVGEQLHRVETRPEILHAHHARTIYQRREKIVVDITARIQAEEKARMYANIVEYLQMGLYVYHLDDVTDDPYIQHRYGQFWLMLRPAGGPC